MTVSLEALQQHIDYNVWASRRLIAAVSGMSPEELAHDFKSADKSILGTLAHLYAAEKNWLARMKEGRAAVQNRTTEDSHLEPLLGKWVETQNGWKAWIRQLPPEAPNQVMEYCDLQGRPWAQPLWQIVLHVVNHATHHRGQISGFLRALGKVPPPLDYIAFVRERAA
ncbi:MAG: DinB family protein [Acidobacteriaceae bacterium]|nr:DinB family protein [Acidobacteriaceae bacterium]